MSGLAPASLSALPRAPTDEPVGINGSTPAYRYPIHLYRSTIQSVSRERLGVTRSPLGQPGRYRRYLSFTSVQSYVDITRSPSGSRDSVVSCDSPHKCSFQGFRGPAQWRARRAAVADCRLSALRIATTKAAERLQLFPHRNVLPLCWFCHRSSNARLHVR